MFFMVITKNYFLKGIVCGTGIHSEFGSVFQLMKAEEVCIWYKHFVVIYVLKIFNPLWKSPLYTSKQWIAVPNQGLL